MNKLILATWCMLSLSSCQDKENMGDLLKPVVTTSEFTDIRNNDTVVYKCITIGGQTWMAENLRYKVEYGAYFGCLTYGEETKKLQVADLEEVIIDAAMEESIPFSVYSEFNTLYRAGKDYPEIIKIMGDKLPPQIFDQFYATKVNEDYLDIYGYLYTLEAAQKAVPKGWRLPTDEDWKTLERSLGMNKEEIDKINVWRGTSQGKLLKDNEEDISFNAKMGGGKVFGTELTGSTFMRLGTHTYFWSSTLVPQNDSTNFAIIRSVQLLEDQILRGTSKLSKVAYSVRCIKE